jgi:hypothetical protein
MPWRARSGRLLRVLGAQPRNAAVSVMLDTMARRRVRLRAAAAARAHSAPTRHRVAARAPRAVGSVPRDTTVILRVRHPAPAQDPAQRCRDTTVLRAATRHPELCARQAATASEVRRIALHAAWGSTVPRKVYHRMLVPARATRDMLVLGRDLLRQRVAASAPRRLATTVLREAVQFKVRCVAWMQHALVVVPCYFVY